MRVPPPLPRGARSGPAGRRGDLDHVRRRGRQGGGALRGAGHGAGAPVLRRRLRARLGGLYQSDR
jgi:hypothetical protein